MNRKEVNATLLGLGWMTSLGVVFVLGILSAFAFHLGPGAAESSSKDLSIDQRQLMLVVERYSGEPADMATIMGIGSGEAIPDQLEQTIRGVLRVGDPDERIRAAVQMVNGLPSRKVMAVIRFLQETPGSPGRDAVLGTFLESWASEDGRRAIVFASSLKEPAERELAIQSVLRGWSKKEPAEAWGWVIEYIGGTRRAERWLAIIVSNLSSVDRATAFHLLEQMPDSGFRDQMSQVVMEQILEVQTPRDAIDWLGEFPSSSAYAASVMLAEAWARTEPEAAARWLYQSFPNEISGYSGVLREWGYIFPEAAADWVWTTFTGQDRRDLMDVLSEEWIANDGPAPLATWINNHGPDLTLDGAIGQLALHTASFDPSTAIVWAQFVTDEDNRSMLEIVIGRMWIRSSPEDAVQRLPMLLQSESARAALLEPEPVEYLPDVAEEDFEEKPLPEEADEPIQ